MNSDISACVECFRSLSYEAHFSSLGFERQPRQHLRVHAQDHGVLPQVSGAGQLRYAGRLWLLLQFRLQLYKTTIIIIILKVKHIHLTSTTAVFT